MTTPNAEYVRTRGGQMIHRKGCRELARVKYGHEWKWAEGMTPADIRLAVAAHSIGPYDWCKTCCADVQNDGSVTP